MQAALVEAASAALHFAHGGRRLPAENLHFTLAFLGAVGESCLPELRELAGRVARMVSRTGAVLELTLDHIDYWRKAQLLCATAQRAPDAVLAFAAALKQELITGGFTPDLKPFRAHVTLVRKVTHGERELAMRPVSWSFTDYALVESRTGPSGSIYSVLDSWALCNAARIS